MFPILKYVKGAMRPWVWYVPEHLYNGWANRHFPTRACAMIYGHNMGWCNANTHTTQEN